jgi:hypothetical protein
MQMLATSIASRKKDPYRRRDGRGVAIDSWVTCAWTVAYACTT